MSRGFPHQLDLCNYVCVFSAPSTAKGGAEITRLTEALAAADLSSLAKPIIEDVGVGSVEALRGYSFGALREALKREANVALNVPQIKKLKAFLS